MQAVVPCPHNALRNLWIFSSQTHLTVRFLCKDPHFHWHACINRRILCYPWWNSSRRLTDLSSSAAPPVAVFIEQVPFSNHATETWSDGWHTHVILYFSLSFYHFSSTQSLYVTNRKIWVYGDHASNYTQQTLNGLSCQPCCMHAYTLFLFLSLTHLTDQFPCKVGQRNARIQAVS